METPRLPASFPKTPTSLRHRPSETSEKLAPAPQIKLPTALSIPELPPRPKQTRSDQTPDVGPYIPENVIDIPTQRLYVCATFILLQAYKLYDIGRLYSQEDDSISELWFILKWVFIDGVFLRSLPLLRIRWLTFNAYYTIVLIFLLSSANIFLCLRYQDAVFLAVASIWKQFFSHEIGLSERRVKVRDIVSSNSHILGKHTVHYLPEGSALLNPSNYHLCYDSAAKESPYLPIMINSSMPSLIQLSVTDFTTSESTTINITQKEIKRLIKTPGAKTGEAKIHHLNYPLKSAGLYRLEKVVDVSQLVVRVRKSELLVVTCPSATFADAHEALPLQDKCRGELSDLTLEVFGLPPMQVRYGRSINRDDKDVTIQSITPIGYQSPLLITGNENISPHTGKDLAWASPQKVLIPLNESLASQGSWAYSIEEVIDGLGNIVKFSSPGSTNTHSRSQRKFSVHERPLVRYTSCSPQNPLMVAKGKQGALPLEITRDRDSAPYEISYTFDTRGTAQDEEFSAAIIEVKKMTLKSAGQPIIVSKPGMYTLKSVSSQYCTGEVLEPSNCLFLTPPDPSLAIFSDEIVDRCAGSSIGLTIDMQLTGSPPFKVYYRTIKDERDTTINTITVTGARHQLRLTPAAAGHYKYEFYSIDDQVYTGVPLNHKELSVKQHIIPMAGAVFVPSSSSRRCCIGESATFTVDMQGSRPWHLEYELVHAGKRSKFHEANITTTPHHITTPKLITGGEYTMVLSTVEDSHGCKVFLGTESRVDVRRQRPSAAFAEIDGTRTISTLEADSISLPLRLAGEKPFRVKYRFTDDTGRVSDHDIVARDFNSMLQVSKRGKYQLLSIHDSICPGTVTENASLFEVSWIGRPNAQVAASPSIKGEGDTYIRNAVCEGDEDALDFSLTGKPPFALLFEQSSVNERGGSKTLRTVDVKAGTSRANLRMDTTKPGIYIYKLRTLADGVYSKPMAPISPITIQQTVNSRPAARFKTPGKVHKYCLEAGTGEDSIPIILEGAAPFTLSVGIKHYSTGKEEIVNIPNVDSSSYVFRVPAHTLTLGGHIVRIHKVRDARGCSQKYGSELPHVSVAVADLPSITSLDPKSYYCVGDRINYSLAGAPPFTLEYTFGGRKEKVTTTSSFQRIAEKAGELVFKSIKDSASECKVDLDISRTIYDIPTVRVSEGSQVVEGIHEGENVEIHFQLQGIPPFTFTYIRSDIPKKGAKPKILEMHTQSTDQYKHTIVASLEGTYEVISINDKYCGYADPKAHEYHPKDLDFKH